MRYHELSGDIIQCNLYDNNKKLYPNHLVRLSETNK